MRQYGSRRVFTVRKIVDAVWRKFEEVPSVWMEGELTNMRRGGDRTYFTLVDADHSDHTQIDAWIYTAVLDKLDAVPADGALVQVHGRVEFWRRRSEVRVRAERMEAAGEGLLLARIAELRRRLEAEGLTASARKRPLPYLPAGIGLVTAREGAARADFLTNVRRRFPGVSIIVVNSLVQGEGAPTEIVAAIRHLDARPDVDVIVLARGGGALEDLMAFNSESVCRAVATSATPIVSAVGHESDVTLCDLVCDLRVSTPTKAAEAVVPNVADLLAELAAAERRATRALSRLADRAVQDLIRQQRRLVGGLRAAGTLAGQRVESASTRLAPGLVRVHRRGHGIVAQLQQQMVRAVNERATGAQRQVTHLGDMLEVLSPQRTVARGYAIVRDGAGNVVGHTADTSLNQRLEILLRDGRLDVRVTGIDRSEGQ